MGEKKERGGKKNYIFPRLLVWKGEREGSRMEHTRGQGPFLFE